MRRGAQRGGTDEIRLEVEAQSQETCTSYFLSHTTSAGRMDSRAALDPHRGDFLLVAVCVEAGDVVIYDFYLLPCKAGVFVKDNLVLLAVLREQQSREPVGGLSSS